MPAIWIQFGECGVHAIGAGGQRGICQHGPTAGSTHRIGDFWIPARHRHWAYSGFPSAVEHMQDHWPAVDFRQRFARQAARRHAGRNDDDWVHLGISVG
jgi:hypothetical protein